jgi:hypothetical protein
VEAFFFSFERPSRMANRIQIVELLTLESVVEYSTIQIFDNFFGNYQFIKKTCDIHLKPVIWAEL